MIKFATRMIEREIKMLDGAGFQGDVRTYTKGLQDGLSIALRFLKMTRDERSRVFEQVGYVDSRKPKKRAKVCL